MYRVYMDLRSVSVSQPNTSNLHFEIFFFENILLYYDINVAQL